MEWMQTVPGMVVCGLGLWLVLSIAFCFLLGQIARRLKGEPTETATQGSRPGAARPSRRRSQANRTALREVSET